MVVNIAIDVLSSLLLCAVVVLVLVGNTFVVLAVATSRKLRTVTNVFIVNLACADLLLGVFILPFSAVLEIQDVWIFGHIWCQVWQAVDVWLCTASILTLCCISLDRYLAITWPIRYPGLMTSRRAKTLVAGIWIFSFLIACPPLIGWNDTYVENRDLSGLTTTATITTDAETTTHITNLLCDGTLSVPNNIDLNVSCREHLVRVSVTTCQLTNSRGYRIYAALGSFFIPMLVMVFFYLQIYRAAVRTISAYEKGELKTKYSVRENENGLKTSSVTLRIHRGGCGFSVGGSGSGSAQQSVYSGSGINLSSRHGVNSSRKDEMVYVGLVGQSSIRRTRSSDASLVTLTDLTTDSESTITSPPTVAMHRRCKSFCWQSERKCVECNKQKIFRDRNQNGSDSRSKLFGTRCVSMDSEESSSCDFKNVTPGSSDQQRLPSQSSVPLTSSKSCQTFESGIVFTRESSTSEKPRTRFSAQKSASAMKLHMQKFNREKKAAKTLAIIVGAFIMCWMPFFTIYLVGAFCDSCISPAVFSIAFWLGYCNSAMNPCVYALFSKDFRFAFKRLMTCKCSSWYRHRYYLPPTYDVPAIQLHCAPQDDARSSSDIDGQWR